MLPFYSDVLKNIICIWEVSNFVKCQVGLLCYGLSDFFIDVERSWEVVQLVGVEINLGFFRHDLFMKIQENWLFPDSSECTFYLCLLIFDLKVFFISLCVASEIVAHSLDALGFKGL